ncbi:MAG: S8 family serine peptidase, partial [bacterium]|nr:S8 family serine peptidase [bacterium]
SLTRDARGSVAGNQELLFIFANGNAGPSLGTVGSPATAKNVLSVGASETSNPDASNGDGCGKTRVTATTRSSLPVRSTPGPLEPATRHRGSQATRHSSPTSATTPKQSSSRPGPPVRPASRSTPQASPGMACPETRMKPSRISR